MSWLDRLMRREAPSADAVPAADAADRLRAEVLDVDGWRPATLEVRATRLSDALNEADGEVTATDFDGAPIDLDTVLLVIPPADDHAGDPARKLHRPGRPLWVRIGEWAVTGSLHTPPGTVGSAFLLRRNLRFFVLTDAVVARSVAGGREERRVPVLLVNLMQVSSLRDTPDLEPAQTAVEVPPVSS